MTKRTMRIAWAVAILAPALVLVLTRPGSFDAGAADVRPPAVRGEAGPGAPAVVAPSAPPRRSPEPATAAPGDAPRGAELRVEAAFQCAALEPPAVAFRLEGLDGWSDEREGASAAWSGLLPGTYVLTASAQGWLADPLDLELGPEGLELRVQLEPRAWIAGVVEDRRTGSPVADFEVAVHERRTSSGAAQVDLVSRTEAFHRPDGSFCIGAPAGWCEEWRLVVSSPRHDPEETEWFSCGSPRSGLVVALEPKGSGFAVARGRVVDPDGKPIPRAQLALIAAEGSPSLVWARGGELRASSDVVLAAEGASGEGRALSGEDGGFALRTSRAGSAKVVAFAPKCALAWSSPFELAPGGEVDVGTLTLGGGASLRGEVLPAHDPRERVELRGVAVELLGGSAIAVGLDADLRFEVDGLEPGTYRVSAEADLRVAARGDERQPLPVASELVHLEPFEERHVVLSGGADVTGTSLRGTLTVPDERLALVWVFLLGEDGVPRRHGILRDDLSFVVPDVPPGSFALVAGGVDAGMSVAAIAFASVAVEAGSAPQAVRLDLVGPRIELQAGEPEAWISIEADTGSEALDALIATGPMRADASGRAEFVCLPEGSYRFRVGDTVKTARVTPQSPPQVLDWR